MQVLVSTGFSVVRCERDEAHPSAYHRDFALENTLGGTRMLQRMRRFLRLAVGERFISVEHETPTRLELRYGGLRTVFDRTEDKVTQNGRLVAVLPLVESIELHKPTSQEGAQNWFITVHVRGQRQVEVGQVTDGTDASIVGARIATVTGRQVKVSS